VTAQNSKNKTSIGNKDRLARLDRGGKLGVGASQLFAVALEVVVSGKSDALSLCEIDFLCVVGEESRTDLRSLCIKKNTCIAVQKDNVRMENVCIYYLNSFNACNANLKLTNMPVLVLGSLSQAIKTCLVSLVITMTEVETSNIHTSLNQLFQLFYFPACWSKSANNFGLAARHIGG